VSVPDEEMKAAEEDEALLRMALDRMENGHFVPWPEANE